MNENLEKYIEGLSPELQEKVKECKTKEELMEIAADNDIELPDDALEMVNGGCSANDGSHTKGEILKNELCPDCGRHLRFHDRIYYGVTMYIRAHCPDTGVLYKATFIHGGQRKWERD